MKKKWIVVAIVTPFLLYVLLFMVPINKEVAYYKPALDILAGNLHAKGKWGPELGVDRTQLYAISEGKLYLKVNGFSRAVLLTTFINPVDWTAKDIAEFRKAHPELESYWKPPEPSARAIPPH